MTLMTHPHRNSPEISNLSHFCLMTHRKSAKSNKYDDFYKKIEEKSNGLDFFDYICIVKLSEY